MFLSTSAFERTSNVVGMSTVKVALFDANPVKQNSLRLSTVTSTGPGSMDEINSCRTFEPKRLAFIPKATKNCDEVLSSILPANMS